MTTATSVMKTPCLISLRDTRHFERYNWYAGANEQSPYSGFFPLYGDFS